MKFNNKDTILKILNNDMKLIFARTGGVNGF
jgi:hypothetical protein